MSGAPRGGSRRAPSRLDVAAALTTVAALLVVAVGVVGYRFVTRSSGDARAAALPVVTTTTVPETTTTTEPPFVGWVDPKSVFGPYAGATVPGLLTFRGNPTRNYYGQGPVPAAPHVLWQYPGKKMCSDSEDRGETTQWCGNGWTGEPAVFERDGRTWLAFGAYDRALHVVDAATGTRSALEGEAASRADCHVEVDAAPVLVLVAEVVRRHVVAIRPHAELRIVGEVVRCGVHAERVAVVGAGRVAARGDGDALVVRRDRVATPRVESELREQQRTSGMREQVGKLHLQARRAADAHRTPRCFVG